MLVVEDDADIMILPEYAGNLLHRLITKYDEHAPGSRMAVVATEAKHPFLTWVLEELGVKPDRYRLFTTKDIASKWLFGRVVKQIVDGSALQPGTDRV